MTMARRRIHKTHASVSNQYTLALTMGHLHDVKYEYFRDVAVSLFSNYNNSRQIEGKTRAAV